jgi:hypothetical protein
MYGISIGELMALAQVDRSTASRWKRGLSRVPHAVLELLRFRMEGDMQAILGAAWSRWRAGRDGLLYGPAWRRGFSPGEILAMPYLYGRIAALERELEVVMRARRLDFHHAGRRCARRLAKQHVPQDRS